MALPLISPRTESSASSPRKELKASVFPIEGDDWTIIWFSQHFAKFGFPPPNAYCKWFFSWYTFEWSKEFSGHWRTSSDDGNWWLAPLGNSLTKYCTVGREIHAFRISYRDVCIALWVLRSGSKIQFESHLTCYDTVMYQYFPTAYNTFSIVSTRLDDFFFVCATRPTDSPDCFLNGILIQGRRSTSSVARC